MAEISKFPYFEIQFTKNGEIHDQKELKQAADGIAKSNATDLFVFSHGWNNDMDDARKLYRDFFASMRAAMDKKAGKIADRKFAVLGILWPSKKFADEDLIPSGAASAGGQVEEEKIKNRINDLKDALDTKAAEKKLEEAKGLVANLENDPAAQNAFIDKVRSLLPKPKKDEEVANEFFTLSGQEIFKKLEAPPGFDSVSEVGGGAAGIQDWGDGGAAGFGDIFSGIKAGALRILNYATYYVMKERAGTVGRDGVSKAISQIVAKSPKLRVHLIGHSFGGRVVTAAADALGDKESTKPASMSLLQAAFSHNGFATKFDGTRDGFFRKVVTGRKVKGPIIITHTHNDQAVGLAYPIASKLSGADASAIGDENDRFGGLGRNGALVKFTPEAKAGQLLASSSSYSFSSGKLFNLEASSFIGDHSDITGKEVANAVLGAVTTS
jgi:esterase/lipase superfamily enzyme